MRHDRRVRSLALVAVALLGALPLVGCEKGPTPPERLEMTWVERSLPPHPGSPGRPVHTGDHDELWHTGDGREWRPVEVPLEPQTAGDHTLMVAAGGGVLVVADAGDGGHVWAREPVSS
jgi:hypothetical protein